MRTIECGSLSFDAEYGPHPARPLRAVRLGIKGKVTIDITVDENGSVVGYGESIGPSLLQSAAKESLKKWRFKPLLVDGEAVKFTGFVVFTFMG